MGVMEAIWEWIGSSWRQLTLLTNLVFGLLVLVIQVIGPANIRGALIRRYRASKAWWDGRGVRRENRKAERLDKAKTKRFERCERDHSKLHSGLRKLMCPDCGYQEECNCPKVGKAGEAGWNTLSFSHHSTKKICTVTRDLAARHTCGNLIWGYWGRCVLCGRSGRFINDMTFSAAANNLVISRLGIQPPLDVCVYTDECDAHFDERYRNIRDWSPTLTRTQEDELARAKEEIEARQAEILRNVVAIDNAGYREALCRISVHPKGHSELPHECMFGVLGEARMCCCCGTSHTTE